MRPVSTRLFTIDRTSQEHIRSRPDSSTKPSDRLNKQPVLHRGKTLQDRARSPRTVASLVPPLRALPCVRREAETKTSRSSLRRQLRARAQRQSIPSSCGSPATLPTRRRPADGEPTTDDQPTTDRRDDSARPLRPALDRSVRQPTNRRSRRSGSGAIRQRREGTS